MVAASTSLLENTYTKGIHATTEYLEYLWSGRHQSATEYIYSQVIDG
jgi:hypothetical protein